MGTRAEQLMKTMPVADPGGGCRQRAPPPKGPDSFVLIYKFFET